MKYAMADGRVFTNWSPNCDLVKAYQQDARAQDAHDVRRYLQTNAVAIMSRAREQCDGAECPVCKNLVTK